MTDEKPLHVRVAEALGWTHIDNVLGAKLWRGIPPGVAFEEDDKGDYPFKPIARYDTDWSATGPLIEKYEITLGRYCAWWRDGKYYTFQSEHFGHDVESAIAEAKKAEEPLIEADSETPLFAICNLILALAAAGKLKP